MTTTATDPPLEVELKLAVAATDVSRLRARLDALYIRVRPHRVHLESRYYDTTDRLLAEHGLALRLRRIGRGFVQTLKSSAGEDALSRRGEWEMPAAAGRLNLRAFASTPLSALLAQYPGARLRVLFTTNFRRELWTTPDGSIEIALDIGEIVAGRRREPLLELELESKGAPESALWELAEALARADAQGAADTALPLLPLGASKAARGHRLARGGGMQPAKANAAAFAAGLASDMPVGQALRLAVSRGVQLLLANAAGALSSDDPEFVHQARVAWRRTRSALRLLRKQIDMPKAAAPELRWIGRTLGAARDADVQRLEMLPALQATHLSSGVLAALSQDLQQRQVEARAQLREALRSARFAALARMLLHWASTGDANGPPLRKFAAPRLKRLRRRLLRSARFFVALSDAEQHDVRIQAKRLRYAIDLFHKALPQHRLDTLRDELAAVQDALGTLNDASVAAAWIGALPAGAVSGEKRAAALELLAARRLQLAIEAERRLATWASLPVPW